MSERVLHCAVNQRHIRRSQPTRDAALKDACVQLLQGHAVRGVDDFEIAETTWLAAVKRWPREKFMLRQGARVVRIAGGPFAVRGVSPSEPRQKCSAGTLVQKMLWFRSASGP